MDPGLLALLLAIVGAGGLGTVIVKAIEDRRLKRAQEAMTLSEGYEKRLAILTSRICALETKQEELYDEIRHFKNMLNDREKTIEELHRENTELRSEVESLRRLIKSKDQRIKVLEQKVDQLTSRLNIMDDEQ